MPANDPHSDWHLAPIALFTVPLTVVGSVIVVLFYSWILNV